MKYYYVYFLTNFTHTVLYIGITNNLVRRTFEHREELNDGFTKTYHVHNLVYYEIFETPMEAIKREKTLKNMVRRKKEDLINKFNPEWKDLYSEII